MPFWFKDKTISLLLATSRHQSYWQIYFVASFSRQEPIPFSWLLKFIISESRHQHKCFSPSLHTIHPLYLGSPVCGSFSCSRPSLAREQLSMPSSFLPNTGFLLNPHPMPVFTTSVRLVQRRIIGKIGESYSFAQNLPEEFSYSAIPTTY